MGHHDEIIFGDAHFPGESCNDNIIRADGLRIDDLLDAVLPLFVLDHVIDQPVMMLTTYIPLWLKVINLKTKSFIGCVRINPIVIFTV